MNNLVIKFTSIIEARYILKALMCLILLIPNMVAGEYY